MPNDKLELTLWDLTQWLAGKLLSDDKPQEWVRLLYDSPYRDTVWQLALKLSQLPNSYTPLVGLDDDGQQKLSEWACGICNAFIKPFHDAIEEKPRNGGTSLSYSGSSPLAGIVITTQNAVSPANKDGENEDGDKATVILSVKGATANKVRNHLVAALELLDSHIKRYN